MPVIDIMLSCKTQIKTQRYITNDDKKHLKMHQAIEKQYSYIKYYYIKSRQEHSNLNTYQAKFFFAQGRYILFLQNKN
jgi:hypothetical protein